MLTGNQVIVSLHDPDLSAEFKATIRAGEDRLADHMDELTSNPDVNWEVKDLEWKFNDGAREYLESVERGYSVLTEGGSVPWEDFLRDYWWGSLDLEPTKESVEEADELLWNFFDEIAGRRTNVDFYDYMLRRVVMARDLSACEEQVSWIME